MPRIPDLPPLRTRSIAGLCSVLVIACGGGARGPDDAPDARLVDCGAVRWSDTSGEPFDRIRIENIPEAIDIPFVEVRTASGFGYMVPLLPESDAVAELSLPMYVDDDGVGSGTAEISLIGQDARCPPVPVEVKPLPDAPDGTLERLVGALEGIRSEHHRLLSLEPGVLLERDFDELAPELIPLAAADRYLMALDGGGSLREALFALPPVERALVADVVAAIDLVRSLEDTQAALAQSGFSANVDVEDGKRADASKQSFQPSSCLPLGLGSRDYIGLGQDTEKLVELLQIQEAVALSNQFRNQVHEDMMFVFSALLAVPSGGASGALGTALLGAQIYDDFKEGMYPSVIPPSSFDFEVKPKFNEDHQTVGHRPEWNNATILARSKGWNLSGTTVDLILNYFPLPLGSAGKWVLDAPFPNAPGMNQWKERLSGELENLAMEGINEAKNDLPPAKCYRLEGQEYGPFDVTDPEYTESFVHGTTITKFSHRSFDLIDIGASEIELVLNPEKFGQELKTRKPVRVWQKQINGSPNPAQVASPGETVVLTVAFDNADFADDAYVDLRAEPASASIVRRTPLAPGYYEVEVATPPDEDSFPAYLFAESLSKTLPEGTPNRSAAIPIELGAMLAIGPRPGCVDKGDPVTFTAVVNPETETDVRWSTTAGSIADSGRTVAYQAPSVSTQVTVSAHLASDPDVKDEVQFRVGDCTEVAVYHAHAAGVSFPGASACDGTGPIFDEEREDQTVEEMSMPPAPPAAAALGAGQAHHRDWSMGGLHTMQFGQLGTNECASADFDSRVELDAHHQVSGAGQRVDVDFALEATSTCRNVPQLDEVCSNAGGNAAIVAVYYIDVREPTSYQFVAELDCRGPEGPFPTGLPSVHGLLARYVGGGGSPENAVPPNGSNPLPGDFIHPQVVGQACNDANPRVRVSQRIDLVGPLGEGARDLVTLTIQLGQGVFGNLGSQLGGGPGIESERASMRGFVELRPVP